MQTWLFIDKVEKKNRKLHVLVNAHELSCFANKCIIKNQDNTHFQDIYVATSSRVQKYYYLLSISNKAGHYKDNFVPLSNTNQSPSHALPLPHMYWALQNHVTY